MPIFGPRGDEDWVNTALVTLTGGVVPSHDDLILDPKDRTPNRNWRDIGLDGEPLGWGIDLPPDRSGHNVYVSRPGSRPAGAGVPADEESPPRRVSLSKQNFVPIPLSKFFVTFTESTYGWQPEAREERRSLLPRPTDAPIVQSTNASRRGFPADTYGVKVDFRRASGRTTRGKGRKTKPSGMSFVTLLSNQGIRVYVPPEMVAGGAAFMGVYVTRPGTNGQNGTERLQEVFDIRHLDARGYVTVWGPHHDGHGRPGTVDESGIGRLPAPSLFSNDGKAAVMILRGLKTLQKGVYRFGYRVDAFGGISKISELTPAYTVSQNTPHAAFAFFYPHLPRGWRIIPVTYYQPLGGGTGEWFELHRSASIRGEDQSYGAIWMDAGVHIYGPKQQESSPAVHRLVSSSRPGDEDTTKLPEPDQGSGPDVEAVGQAGFVAPATYLVATTDEDEVGNETGLSPTASQAITLGQGIRVQPVPPTNKIVNPEGAHRSADSPPLVFGWNNLGTLTGGGTSSWTSGSLIINGTASQNLLPAPETDYIDLPNADVAVTVKGQMRVSDVRAVSASQMVLRWYDSTNAQIGSDVVLLQSATVGRLSLGDLGTTLTVPDGASRIKLVFKSNGATWNSTVFFENLGLFFLSSGLRKFDSVGDDQPVIFNPTGSSASTNAGIATPFPSGSAHAVGPINQAEEIVPSAAPLVEVVDFEGSVWPGSGATAWSTTPFTNNATEAIEATSAIFGTRSVRHQNTGTNVIARFLRRRTYTDAEMGGASQVNMSFRFYDANPLRPTSGEVTRARINDQNGNTICSVRYTKGNIILIWFTASGTSTRTTAVTGLADGVSTDIEVSVVNGNTTSGRVLLTCGTNGNTRRKVAEFANINLTGRRPRQVEFGAEENTASSTWTLRADNLIVSRNGAPLAYETPTAPSGTTIPATQPAADAPPLAGGGFRLYDSQNAPLNQWWFWIEPTVRRRQSVDYGPYTEGIITVVPGETITHAVAGGWVMHEVPDEPSHQFFVTLHGPDVEPLHVGSPFAAGRDATAASRAGGTRSNNASTVGMAASATINNTEDFWQTFVVPAGYMWATIAPKYGAAGYYVFQEPLFARGNLTTQAGRDAARDYTRATTGTATVLIPTTNAIRNPYSWALSAGRLALGLKEGNQAVGATVTSVLYSSGPTTAGPFSTAVSDPTLVPENLVYKVTFTMGSDGLPDGDTPVVGRGSVYAIVKPYMSQLLRSDRDPLKGVVFVNGVDSPSDRPDTEVLRVDGEVFAPRRSKKVSYFTKEITLHISTEEDKRYLESLQPDDELAIESPDVGGTGRVFIIRPGQGIDVDTSLPTVLVSGSLRSVYGTATLAAAQVIDEAPLIPT